MILCITKIVIALPCQFYSMSDRWKRNYETTLLNTVLLLLNFLYYTILIMLYSIILYDFLLYCTALYFTIIILYHSFIWLFKLSLKHDYSLLAGTRTRTCRKLLCVSFANIMIWKIIYIYIYRREFLRILTHFWIPIYSDVQSCHGY